MKKIFFWGGKAKAKIIQKMILNEESKDVEISIIYDPLIKELPFESSSKFISSPNELKLALADITHFIMVKRSSPSHIQSPDYDEWKEQKHPDN